MEKGMVYQICDFGSIPEVYKIGITKNNPEKRLKQLQTGSANEMVLLRVFTSIHYKKIEKHLHRMYSKYSTDGGREWFQLPSSVVLEFEKDCKEAESNFEYLSKNNEFFI